MTKPRSYEALWLRFLCHMISFFFFDIIYKMCGQINGNMLV